MTAKCKTNEAMVEVNGSRKKSDIRQVINDGVRYKRRLIGIFIEIEILALNKKRQSHCWIIWITKSEGRNRCRYTVKQMYKQRDGEDLRDLN